MIGLVPSVLSADFTRLGEQVREVEAAGAQRIQIDVMDGHFVPNITMGPMIIAAIRRCTSLPLEAHLMITNPEEYIEDFARAGADVIIFHQEVTPHLHRVIQQIKAAGQISHSNGWPMLELSQDSADLGDSSGGLHRPEWSLFEAGA